MYIYVDFVLRFIALYRLNKTAFRRVYKETAVKVVFHTQWRLLIALSFLAVGFFQDVIANDINLGMGSSTLYKML